MRLLFMAGLVALVGLPVNAAAQGKEACRQAYAAKKPEAYRLCFELTKERDAEAQRMVGDMFFFGWGDSIKQDYKEAFLWYRRASLNGDVDAKYNMGVMTEKGLGAEKNLEHAVKWFRSAGKDGHIAAQLNLGNMYSRGEGIDVNDARASEWYLRAAKQGDAVAQYNIGTRLAKGQGIEVDMVEAFKWLTLAKRAGVEEAKPSLATLRKHIGISDVSKAEKLADGWLPEYEKPGKNYLGM